jgi:hypothetical protein
MAMNKKRQNILMIKTFIYTLQEQKELNLEDPPPLHISYCSVSLTMAAA